MSEQKVSGIGGIFFKCEDPDKLRQWYADNLGLVTNEYGALFEFRKKEDPDQLAYLQWSTFSNDTKYLEPSDKPFMINYRVRDIEKIVEELKAAGVNVVDEIQEFEYGKFVHLMDPEGNKLELWEPVDKVFTDWAKGKTNS